MARRRKEPYMLEIRAKCNGMRPMQSISILLTSRLRLPSLRFSAEGMAPAALSNALQHSSRDRSSTRVAIAVASLGVWSAADIGMVFLAPCRRILLMIDRVQIFASVAHSSSLVMETGVIVLRRASTQAEDTPAPSSPDIKGRMGGKRPDSVVRCAEEEPSWHADESRLRWAEYDPSYRICMHHMLR